MEMYNGMPGSPITYLTSAISANQTTIAIGDDTALPEAPNLCTIGYGEHIETIRYGEKSNGVLQDVTRGIEGDPRAWPIGTEVARFFTAYDHNAIIQTINEHKAESANKHIHSQGDGWIRFDNGWQICTKLQTVNSNNVIELNTNIGGGIYRSLLNDISYTRAFALVLYNDFQVVGADNVPMRRNVIGTRVGHNYLDPAIAIDSWLGPTILHTALFEPNKNMYLSFFAVGLWKLSD